jgi:hypothetical protein
VHGILARIHRTHPSGSPLHRTFLASNGRDFSKKRRQTRRDTYGSRHTRSLDLRTRSLRLGGQEKDELEVEHRLQDVHRASVANMCMEFWHEYIARTLQVRRCTAPCSRLMVGTLARSGGRLGWIHTAVVTRLSWPSRRLRWRICAWNFGTNTSHAPFRFAAAPHLSRA